MGKLPKGTPNVVGGFSKFLEKQAKAQPSGPRKFGGSNGVGEGARYGTPHPVPAEHAQLHHLHGSGTKLTGAGQHTQGAERTVAGRSAQQLSAHAAEHDQGAAAARLKGYHGLAAWHKEQATNLRTAARSFHGTDLAQRKGGGDRSAAAQKAWETRRRKGGG